MSAIYALYDDGDAAQRAVNGLRNAGVADSAITVISDQPMEAYEFGEMNRATRIWYIASIGGLVGLVFATWLTRMTELAWPLPTGNMPIVSWWPNLIVIFELTMLGAILATVATLLVTGELLRRRPALYDPRVTDGKILVGVENAARAEDVERALVAAGSPQITRI
jgi:Alternative complex III, ActD subunit